MNILVKYPIRARVAKFWQTLKAYREMESGKHVVQYVVTADKDDPAMNQRPVKDKLYEMDRLAYRYGDHPTKVHACNADMDLADDGWEIVVLISDDMVPETVGWDDRIAKDMQARFPNTDGCLWYYDGYCQPVCTLSILGRKWYDRFGYIYHPDYTSLWCDNEHTQVAMEEGRMWRCDDVIIRHKHHVHGFGPSDQLLQRNEKYYGVDQEVFKRRQKAGFPK